MFIFDPKFHLETLLKMKLPASKLACFIITDHHLLLGINSIHVYYDVKCTKKVNDMWVPYSKIVKNCMGNSVEKF